MAYVSRSTSQHFPFLVLPDHKIYKVGGKCGLAMFPRSRLGLGWQCEDPYRSGDSIPPLLGLFGALGDPFGTIFLFWGCPPGSPLFVLLYPYSPGVAVLCCVLIFVPLCKFTSPITRLPLLSNVLLNTLDRARASALAPARCAGMCTGKLLILPAFNTSNITGYGQCF